MSNVVCPKQMEIIYGLLSISYRKQCTIPNSGYIPVPEAVLICFCKDNTTGTEVTIGVEFGSPLYW